MEPPSATVGKGHFAAADTPTPPSVEHGTIETTASAMDPETATAAVKGLAGSVASLAADIQRTVRKGGLAVQDRPSR